MLHVRRYLALWGGPLLIVLLAANHLWRAEAYDQSAWKGGGFGMFSTVDSEVNRVVRAFVVDASGAREHVSLAGVSDVVYEARVVPTEANLRRVALALLARHVEAAAVRVEVRRAQFDGDRNVLFVPLLRSIEVAR